MMGQYVRHILAIVIAYVERFFDFLEDIFINGVLKNERFILTRILHGLRFKRDAVTYRQDMQSVWEALKWLQWVIHPVGNAILWLTEFLVGHPKYVHRIYRVLLIGIGIFLRVAVEDNGWWFIWPYYNERLDALLYYALTWGLTVDLRLFLVILFADVDLRATRFMAETPEDWMLEEKEKKSRLDKYDA